MKAIVTMWLAGLTLLAGLVQAQEMPSRVFYRDSGAPAGLRSVTAPSKAVGIAPSARDLAEAAASSANARSLAAKSYALGTTPPPQPHRVGSVFAGQAAPLEPVWQTTPDQGSVTHIEVTSKGAAGVRAQLMLPAGLTNGEIRVAARLGDTAVAVPLSVAQDGMIWTPYTEGETQIVELYTRQNRAGVKVTIAQIVHFEESLLTAADATVSAKAAGTCTVDVACGTGNTATDAALAHIRQSVARLNFISGAGSYVCTGTLINSQQAPVPFFLTANHCISTAADAASVSTLWFYYAATCGGTRPLGTIVGGGAQLVFSNHMTDSTLLRLNLLPPSGAEYAGWNAALIGNGDSVVSVSHPAGDIMKTALGTLSYPDSANGWIRIQGYPFDFYSVAFTRGIIQGGSSGSGLFTVANGSLQLRGILSGTTVQYDSAGMSCTNTSEHALYGRFEVFYPDIKPYLDNVAYPVDDYPNQPDPTATQLPLGGSLNGTIERAGDLDVFKIVIKQAGKLTVGSSGGYDTVGVLLNADGSCFKSVADPSICDINATSDDGANNAATDNNFRMDGVAILPGTYYLQVGMWDPNAISANGYQVYALFKPDAGLTIPLSQRGGIDLDGKGKGAILVRSANAQSLAGRLVNNQFQFTTQADPGAAFRLSGAIDLDGDGKSDLVFLNITQGDSGEARAWNSFLAANESLLRTVKTAWYVQAVGDLDGDGYGDLVWRFTGSTANANDTGVSYVWFSNGSAITQVRKRGGAPLDWTLLGALDLNGDAAADLLYVGPTNQMRALMATADRTCANLSAGTIPDGYKAVKFADFTGSGRGDILIRNTTTGVTQLLSLNATALVMPPPSATPDDPNAGCTASALTPTTTTTTLPTVSSTWQFYASGDFNGDGVVDIVWLQPNGTLTLWLMTAGGGAPTVIANAGTAPSGYTVFQP